jgi:phosphatidylglycerol:prolipoprotein diacylglycerol transferase
LGAKRAKGGLPGLLVEPGQVSERLSTHDEAGCAIAHDHKGHLTDSWLAVRFPEGARYDLGLIEWSFTPFLCALVVYVGHRTKRPGAVSGALAVAYALVRFPLDFLRATDLGEESDRRYAGITPGQWASGATLCFGVWALSHARRHARYDSAAA